MAATNTLTPSADDTGRAPGRVRTAALAVVLLYCGHLSALVGLIASNAQAGVAQHFHTTQIAWFTLASSLVGFFCMPFVTKAAAFYGKRRALLAITVAGFVGDLLSALATSYALLVVGRAITGAYIGVGTALVYALIRDVFPKEKVSSVTGFYATGSSVMALFGPFLASWLIDDYGFRAALWFITAATALTVVLLVWFVPESPVREERTAFDWTGGIILGASLTAVVYGIAEGPKWGWTSGGILAFLIGGGAGLLIFVLVERSVAHPILPTALLARRAVWSVVLSTSLAIGALFSFGTVTYLLALYPNIPHVSAGLGFSVTKNAVIGLPGGIILIGVAILSGRLARRHDPRKMLALGALLFTAWVCLYVPFHHSALQLVAVAPVGAIGGGLMVATSPVMIISATSRQEQVLVNGAFAMVSGVVNNVLGALTFALLASRGTTIRGIQFYSEDSYRAGFWMYAGAGLLTLLSVALIPKLRRVDEADIGLEAAAASTAPAPAAA